MEHVSSLRKTVQRCLSLLLSSSWDWSGGPAQPVKPLFLPKTTSTVRHTSPAWPTKVLTLLKPPSGEKVQYKMLDFIVSAICCKSVLPCSTPVNCNQAKFRPVERHWPEVVQMEGKAQVIRCKIWQCSLPPFPVLMFVKNLNLFRLIRNTLTNGLDNRHALLVLLTISSLWILGRSILVSRNNNSH